MTNFGQSFGSVQICSGLYLKSVVFPTSGTGWSRKWANLANPSLRDTWVRFAIGLLGPESSSPIGTVYTSRGRVSDVTLVGHYLVTGKTNSGGGHNGPGVPVSTGNACKSVMIFLGKSDSIIIGSTLNSFFGQNSLQSHTGTPFIQFLSTSP